jgi:wyosine [tRNA(Phe)-imidazoG37] synthetase (radical SAM superfamily)
MNNYLIDSHKLIYHPREVANWLDNQPISPIYLELGPSGGCNHRCIFCGMDFARQTKRRLPTEIINLRFPEMASEGVKAIMFAGEGEPFLNYDMTTIALQANKAGIDISFTTNGVLLTPEISKNILPITTWIKISCNAGTSKTYSKIHRTLSSDFNKMWNNLEYAINFRANNNYDNHCTIGFQILVLPENRNEIITLAKRIRDIGGDYLVLKPYSVNPKALHSGFNTLNYRNYDDLEATKDLNTSSFKVIFRKDAMERSENHTMQYLSCLALPFWGFIDSGANFWGCLRHIGENDFNFGNLINQTFKDVVYSQKRLNAIKNFELNGNIENCHIACRMDSINYYLWELRHPSPHVNFI